MMMNPEDEKPARMETCGRCQGEGVLTPQNSEPRQKDWGECPECEGTGEVPVADDSDDAAYERSRNK